MYIVLYILPPTMKVIDQHVATLFLNVFDEIMMIMMDYIKI